MFFLLSYKGGVDRSIEIWDWLLTRYGVPFDSNQCDQNVTERSPLQSIWVLFSHLRAGSVCVCGCYCVTPRGGHCLREAGAGGSNPLTPTIYFFSSQSLSTTLRGGFLLVVLSVHNLSTVRHQKWQPSGSIGANLMSRFPRKATPSLVSRLPAWPRQEN